MTSRFRIIYSLLGAVTLLVLFMASANMHAAPHSDYVKASLVALDESIQPGTPLAVALRLEHAPHWHTYWINAGTGYPTSLKWELPDDWKTGEIQWPVPAIIKDRQGSVTGNGYEGVVYLPIVLTPPPDVAVGSNVTLHAKAEWLMCSESCVPGDAEVSLTLPVLNSAPKASDLREKILRSPPMSEKIDGAWHVSATRAPGTKTIALTFDALVSDKAAAKVLANMSPHFFSADGFVQYDQPQSTVLAGDNAPKLTFTLPVSDSYDGDGKRLVGVLAFTDGNSMRRGYAVDVLLNDNTTNAAANGANAVTPTANTASGAEAGGFSAGILFFAFFGGLILNLMPCVFPVLGIKILGFVNQAGADRRKVTMHGIVFTVGVLVSFWVLAGLLAILRASGDQLGWGFQLQSPIFVFVLAAVMLVFGLSMSGVFEFGLSATSAGAGLQEKNGYSGSFFTGVLATAVATPCSAPLLAPALGAALAMPVGESFLVFTLIALGLSTPYLLLSIFPGAIKVLPRPGAWMETFKQIMAFPLYATVGYLVWVLAGQLSENGLLSALFGLVLIAMAAWFYGRYTVPGNSAARRRFGVVATLVFVVLGCWLGWPRAAAPTDIVWEKWSPAAVESARASGKTVYVDFTARWCATCQANKKLVFGSDEVKRVFRDKKIVTLKGDWTNSDPQITAELARFNRSAVPFNLIYKPGQVEPIVLPELLTPGIVLDNIARP